MAVSSIRAAISSLNEYGRALGAPAKRPRHLASWFPLTLPLRDEEPMIVGAMSEHVEAANPEGKRARTRRALIETAVNLIAARGIANTAVIDITQALGVSNGIFYYHFENKEQLLEVIGHNILISLVEQIGSEPSLDPADLVARGPLVILSHADRHRDQLSLMVRVVEDSENRHGDLGNDLLRHIEAGIAAGRFLVDDPYVAMRFCRSLVGTALRLRHEWVDDPCLDVITARQTLMALGVASGEAAAVVERGSTLLQREEFERPAAS